MPWRTAIHCPNSGPYHQLQVQGENSQDQEVIPISHHAPPSFDLFRSYHHLGMSYGHFPKVPSQNMLEHSSSHSSSFPGHSVMPPSDHIRAFPRPGAFLPSNPCPPATPSSLVRMFPATFPKGSRGEFGSPPQTVITPSGGKKKSSHALTYPIT